MIHDFRPGDVVEFIAPDDGGRWGTHSGVIVQFTENGRCVQVSGYDLEVNVGRLTLVSRPAADPAPTPTKHPSRARAASSLRAASASLTTAVDHLTRAGEAETYPGQTVIRIRTASEETQACIQHATMAMYWLLHERLGS